MCTPPPSVLSHYTGHFKAVVAKPQNVCVLRDVMANGYRAGNNTKWFSPNGNMGNARQAMMERLAFEDGDGEDYPPSMLAFPIPKAEYEAGKCSTVMSITSRLLPWEVQDQSHKSFPGGEANFKAYAKELNLPAVHFGEDLRASENMVRCGAQK